MVYNSTRALELLRIGSGNPSAIFRDGQEQAIRHVVEGQGRILVVQKTGWGKSFVYFIATRLLREQGAGPALLISPLLSLMRNQIAAARRMGVRAETINSDNRDEWASVEDSIRQNRVDIILISPERLANQQFLANVLANAASRISLLVIDEAHCISDWGHDFRPHYRLLERIVRYLPANMRLLATTATANNRVINDVTQVLGTNLHISRGDLNRPSLTLQTINLPSQAERLAWLAEQLISLKGSGIIYTLTVRDANQVADWLQSQGFHVAAYTAEAGENREGLENALLNNQVKALVATVALGMGYDKPDLAFVIHYQMPSSVVAYYQQVGRAGRALTSAYGILLRGEEEDEISDWFISSAFPTRNEVDLVLRALNHVNGLSVPELMAEVNLSKTRIEKTLLALSLESSPPITKEATKWKLTVSSLNNTFWQRAERLTQLRQEEHLQMQEYVNLPFGQHMSFLIHALDGDPITASYPLLPPLPTTVDANIVQEAISFLSRTGLLIEPRKMWPSGLGLPRYGVKGKIPSNNQAHEGIALSIWGDAGWGKIVKKGRYEDQYFNDQLVDVCVAMFKKWNPQPTPTWVTCIPSLRHPDLVPNFALRLAQQLQLPFHMVLEKTAHTKEQKSMANSTQQARNIDGSLRLNCPSLPHGPVLLVDDIVNSGWTFTVAAWLLRSHGGGIVWPIALSTTG